MARNARQHKTTKIEFSCYDTEVDARTLAAKTGDVAKQARLVGEVVWSVVHQDGTVTAFITPDQGRKIGLCMYRWCRRKIEECNYHPNR